jgi:ATP-binding cassette subfamily B multidrug efflux pump
LRFLRQIRPLYPYLRRYRGRYALGFLALLGNNSVWVVLPMVMRAAVDSLATGLSRERILLYVALMLATAAVRGVFQYASRQILIGISRDIEFDLRNDLFQHLTTLPQAYYQRNRTGDIMARATNDMNAVRMMVGPGIMYSGNTVLVMILAAAIMTRLDGKLTAIILLPVPLVSFSVVYFGRLIHERFERIQEMFSDLSAAAQENLAGVRVVKAYAQEDAEIERFRRMNVDYLEQNRRLIRVWGVFYPALDTLIGITFVLVLWRGGREVIAGHISLGSYVAFNTYLVQLAWPMIALGWVVNLGQRGVASLDRLFEIFHEKPGIGEPENPAEVGEVRGEIEFRDLTFAYNGEATLHSINLAVAAGKTLAIVGPTGSGKSTLVSLIPRIHEVPPASVFVDGVDLRRFPLAKLRHAIGFVPQETFLFSATIRENICFGASGTPTNEEVAEAAAIAGIHADIAGFPNGYDTVVGERGITLSGGQRQRTAIARALLRNPRLLILDDALSSVDTETEERILTRLREVMQGRTAILISHRVSTVQAADEIVVLEGGAIVERGTHAELLELGGYYAGLYQKQLLEEELSRQ